ncbi:hypothetical protein R3P38DRAFT_3423015 [Favolaschia claudopus]|uniref:Uncharacterized protein n=1 Tax=Favolaschia claudopus TaxID=2862362 RepID=A0AAW0D946_9AGAR
MPWLGFIKRDGERTAGEVEYESVMSAWYETEGGGQVEETHVSTLLIRNQELEDFIGHVVPQLLSSHPALCSQRPKPPRQQDIERLRDVKDYEEALDRLVHIHRGIKEKQAWYTLARLRVETSVSRENSSSPVPIPLADDAYLGTWINGVDRLTVDWLLHVARLPCFVISEVAEGVESDRIFSSFVHGTLVEGLCSPHNGYDLVAASGLGFTSYEQPAFALDAPSLSSLERVAAKANPKGSWSVFREVLPEYDEPDVGPIMRLEGGKRKGKANMEDEDEMWFDRTRKRKLIIASMPPLPPSLAGMDPQFGRPAPTWPFGARSNDKWITHQPSLWMYPSEEPHPAMVGAEYTPPELETKEPELRPVAAEEEPTPMVVDELPVVQPLGTPPTEGRPRPIDEDEVSLGPSSNPPSRASSPVPEHDLFAEGVDAVMSDALDAMQGLTTSAQGESLRREASPISDSRGRSASLYVLLKGLGYSINLSEIRAWLSSVGGGFEAASIVGLYRRVLESYQADYVVELTTTSNAERLFLAALDNRRITGGAVFLDEVEFRRVTMGIGRRSLTRTPSPERSGRISRLPSIPRIRREPTPPEMRRESPATLPRNQPAPISRELARARDVARLQRVMMASEREEFLRRQGGTTSVQRDPVVPTEDTRRKRARSPSTEASSSVRPRKEIPREPRAMREKRESQTGSQSAGPTVEDHRRRTLTLVDRLTDPESRPPRLLERLTEPNQPADSTSGPSAEGPPLLERLSGPTTPSTMLVDESPRSDRLIERISGTQTSPDDSKEKLMHRVDVKLQERVLTVERPKRRRTHRRTDKRVSRIEVLVRSPSPEPERFAGWPWTDDEIDWFIDQEEFVPDADEDDDAMDEN